MGFDPVPYAIPFFVLLIVAEMLWARARAPQAYEPRDTLTSLALGLGSTAVGIAAAGALYAAAMWLYAVSPLHFRLAVVGLGTGFRG